MIAKSSPQSAERLLSGASLFLHRIDKKVPGRARLALNGPAAADHLVGKKILVVDDDVRSVFAITSALESHKMEVVYAETGKTGLEMLQRNPDLDAVLMDVMMPGMDGYETIRRIRQEPAYADLPIIAVTAKALHEDQEKCIKAGASDYLPKPVDPDRLVEMISQWTRP